MRIINIVISILTGISIIFGAAYSLMRIEGQVYALRLEVTALNQKVGHINMLVNVNIRDFEVLMKLLEKNHVV